MMRSIKYKENMFEYTFLMNIMLMFMGMIDIYFTTYTIKKYEEDKQFYKNEKEKMYKEIKFLKEDINAIRYIGKCDFEGYNDGNYDTEDLNVVKKNLYPLFLECINRNWERDSTGRLVRVH
jgi:hypothetical protein